MRMNAEEGAKTIAFRAKGMNVGVDFAVIMLELKVSQGRMLRIVECQRFPRR